MFSSSDAWNINISISIVNYICYIGGVLMKKSKTFEVKYDTGIKNIPTSIVRIKTTTPAKAEAMFKKRYPKRAGKILDIYGEY